MTDLLKKTFAFTGNPNKETAKECFQALRYAISGVELMIERDNQMRGMEHETNKKTIILLKCCHSVINLFLENGGNYERAINIDWLYCDITIYCTFAEISGTKRKDSK